VLDAGSGRVVRVLSLGRRAFVPTTYGAPLAAVDPRTGRVFVPTSRQLGSDGSPEGPGTVTVLDGRSGALLRTLPVGHAPLAVALDGRTRRVFVLNSGYQPTPQSTTSVDGGLSVLDADSGRPLARMPDEGGTTLAVDERTQRVFALEGSVVDVLDAATGRRRARVVLSPPDFGYTGYYMAVDERAGRVLVGLEEGLGVPNGIGLDATTGAMLYSLDTQQQQRFVGGPLAVDPHTGHTVWVGLQGTHINFYDVSTTDTRTGRLVRAGPSAGLEGTNGVGFAAAIATDPAHGRAVLVTAVTATGYNGNQVAVIDTGSGRFRRVMELGAGPPAIAVDERAGRVFVANGGANTVSVLDAAPLIGPARPASPRSREYCGRLDHKGGDEMLQPAAFRDGWARRLLLASAGVVPASWRPPRLAPCPALSIVAYLSQCRRPQQRAPALLPMLVCVGTI